MRVSDSAVGGDADQVAKLEVGNRALIGVETLVLSTSLFPAQSAIVPVEQSNYPNWIICFEPTI